jgi:hypothetical protein
MENKSPGSDLMCLSPEGNLKNSEEDLLLSHRETLDHLLMSQIFRRLSCAKGSNW